MEKFAYRAGYSDRDPFEVVRVVNERCVEVRAMKAAQLHRMEELEPHPGGFACHYANQRAQRWDIQPDPEAPVVRIRLSAAKRKAGKWFDKYGSEYRASDQPYKFHDYNF